MKHTENEKALLDEIITKNKAQPVGCGYIDIIVKREYYQQFIIDIIRSDFRITDISWWVYNDSFDIKDGFGYGGPPSIFFPGWFSELSISLDEIESTLYSKNGQNYEDIIKFIESLIEKKTIKFADSTTLSFLTDKILTPALWLDVPNDWKNEIQQSE